MKRFSRIFAVALLMATVLAAIPFLPSTGTAARARASVPVFETNGPLLANVQGIDISSFQDLVQKLYEWGQTFVLETLKKRLLDMIVDQTIQWIQGGGEPKFVTDWQGFLSQAANEAAGQAAQLAGLGFLCSPFSLRVQVNLIPVPRFTEQITCTLDQIVNNVNAFYADFRNGSWIGYSALLEPQNNYYGATLIAWEASESAKAKAQSAAGLDALSGGGFLSTKKCDANGENCTITTPGSTIGGLVSKAVGSDIDYIVNAEQLSAYVAAISNAVINRLIIEGVEGIRGLTTRNSPPGGAIPPGLSGCAGLSGSAFSACVSYAGNSENSFAAAKADIISHLDRSLIARQNANDLFIDSLQRLRAYETDLRNLLALFAPETCLRKTEYVAAINNELAFASSTLPAISNEKALNQIVIDELIIAKTNVDNLPADDWTAFSTLVNQLQRDGLLNPGGAVAFEDAARAENQNLRDRIAEKIQEFNRNLDRCRRETIL